LVEAMVYIFQVVMLSAMRNFTSALPSASVITSGRQSNVSGKYSRSLGVEVSCSSESDERSPGFVDFFATPG
jgi:hypothetical protein